MAVDLKISLDTCDCNSLTFNELTNYYSVSNPTGWGTPNDLISSAISAILVVTTPTEAPFTFNVLLSSFPTNNTLVGYNIPYTSLTMSSGLIDGIYSATYTVVTSVTSGDVTTVTTYTTTNQFLITCNLECCIQSMLLDIDDFTCDCNKDKKDKYLTALALFNSIEHSKECGDINEANEDIIIANKLCKNQNCLTCKDNHR
jgi:hypothetical protein